MSDDFELVEQAIGPVVEIEERVPVWKMPSTFTKDFKKIADYIELNDAKVIEMPYGYYLDMDWERELNRSKFSAFLSMFAKKWHLIVGMVSSKPLTGSGEIKAKVKDVQKFVQAIHLGPYQTSSKTYKALLDWSKTQGITLKNEAYEFYANDPRAVPKEEVKTVILIPVATS